MCVAFHPRFLENRKYYVNYHVRNQGSFFSPVIVERQATPDLRRDAGVPSRRLLQIHQDTDIHWGGMLAFGPDGYLYIGAGDAGPQEDPEGHGQDLSLLTGAILRIDVDRQAGWQAVRHPRVEPLSKRRPAHPPGDLGVGFSHAVAVQLRPGHGRPVGRRRRPEPVRRGLDRPRRREPRLERLRRLHAVLGSIPPRGRDVHAAGVDLSPQVWRLGHGRLRLSGEAQRLVPRRLHLRRFRVASGSGH